MPIDWDPGPDPTKGTGSTPSRANGEVAQRLPAMLARFWRLESSSGLRLWRAKILTAVLWAVALLALIAYVPSVVMAFQNGSVPIVIVDTLALLVLFGLLAARRAPYRLRAGGLLAVCFGIGVYFTWGFGPIASGPLWLFATPVLAALLFGLPGAAGSLALTTLCLVAFGILLHDGTLAWDHPVTTSMWLIISSSFVCLSALLAVSVSVVLGGVVDLHEQFEREVEAREKADRQLQQTSKLEALGRLAGGVAHDFNNILTAILGYAEMVRSEVRNRADLVELLGGIDDSANRAAGLTRGLLAFSRQQELNVTEVDVSATLASMQSMLRRLIREDIRFEIGVVDGAWQVLGDRGQLEQVVLNLVVNAADAIGGTGTIDVGVGGRHLSADDAAVLGVVPGDFVEITVVDDGGGMTEEVRSRIFEPFFTTKGLGEGTGLGLATVHGIVVKSGGAIVVDSRVGHGTTFTILLPRAPEDEEAGVPAAEGRSG